MSEKRLIFFTGVYDTLDIFTCELQREFERMGYETMLFDSGNTEEGLRRLAGFLKKPVKAAITFNNLGYNMELVAGKNIWDELGICCINILMDHPFCYKAALDGSPKFAAVLCTDRNHMRYIQRFYPQIPVTGYLPHAGIDRGTPAKRIADRQMDVLYAGGLSRKFAQNIYPDFAKYTEFDARQIGDEAYRLLVADPKQTTEAAIERVLMEKGICLSEEALFGLIADLHYVDLLATSRYRELVIKTLVEAGISVHLYGYGWEECNWIDSPNLHYGGRVSAEEIVEKMRDAKIVLSTMTWFKDGTHDRVFNGMLAGAVAVTDSSVYMREEFGDGKGELVMFELTELAGLPEQVRGLLSDLEEMQRIAERGRACALKKHTWRERARELEEDLLCQL